MTKELSSKTTTASRAEAMTAKSFNALLQDVTDFSAVYETLQNKLKAREFALEQKLAAAERQLSAQLSEIYRCLEKFTGLMTKEGAAQGQATLREINEETRASLNALQTKGQEIETILKETGLQLENIVTQSVAQLASVEQVFPAAEFKKIAQDSCDTIQKTAAGAMQRIAGFIQQFHRKNLLMAFVMTLFMACVLGLYLNGEWPWEIHREVLKERDAGRALLIAWPKLTAYEQDAIEKASKGNLTSSP